MILRPLIFIGLIALSHFSHTQNIQWANKVEFQFHEYEEEEWSGIMALGEPDVKPLGKLDRHAFRLKGKSDFGTLIVSYEKPQVAKKIIVVENYLPGRITEILLHDTEDKTYTIYNHKPVAIHDQYRVLIIPVPKAQYLVKEVEINIDTYAHPGWSEVDAIGISDIDDDEVLHEELEKYGFKIISEEIGFASKRENLGPKINTPFNETKPVISPDGKTLYFARQNYPGNYNKKRDRLDIYYSKLDNGQWELSKNIGPPLNDSHENGVSSVTPDGNTLLLINYYDEENDYMEESQALSISNQAIGGWEQPKSVVVESFHNKNLFEDFYLTSNKKALLISLEDEGSYGNQDIYVCFPKGKNRWSKPINLGPTINTIKADFAPFLAADNKTLFFASEGHKGFGKSDIFYSKRIDDGWQDWTTPKNLGSAINTIDWEGFYSVSASGDYAYFVSNKESIKGSSDIFRIALPEEFKPEPVLLIKGKVFDKITKKPLGAEIVFESLTLSKEEGTARSNPNNGEYKIVLHQGDHYGYWGQINGYMPIKENIDLHEINEYKEITKDLYLVPLEPGLKARLNNIFFDRGKSDILPKSNSELNWLVDFLKRNATITIEISGHTDNQGSRKLNYELSQERVDVIKEYLVKRGIDKDRLVPKAYGGTKPIASNASEETRKLNRRVEIMILSLE